VDISFTVCYFVCVFVRLRISPARIKLAVSNFARWFIGVLGRESPILGNFAPRKPKIGRIGQRASECADTRQSPSLTEIARVPTCGRRIGICGYTAVPEDGILVYDYLGIYFRDTVYATNMNDR